jgi:hypothetical protein
VALKKRGKHKKGKTDVPKNIKNIKREKDVKKIGKQKGKETRCS